MAMKYETFKKIVPNQSANVKCYGDMEGDGPTIKRIIPSNPGFTAGTSAFFAGFINNKSHFVFNGKREGRERAPFSGNNVLGTRNLTSNGGLTRAVGERIVSENEGSKGDAERRWGEREDTAKKLGCDGDVVKCTGTTGYFLSSSGARGDILKPLDEDAIKSLEYKKNLLLKSRSKDDNVNASGAFHDLPRSISLFNYKEGCIIPSEKKPTHSSSEPKIYCSSFPNKETSLHDFLASLVSQCQGNNINVDLKKEERTLSDIESKIIKTSEEARNAKNNISLQSSAQNLNSVDILKHEIQCNQEDSSSTDVPEQIDRNDKCKENLANCSQDSSKEEILSVEISVEDSLLSAMDISQEKDCIVEIEERELLDLYTFEVERKLAWKQSLCEANKNVTTLRPDDTYFTKLDSSLKKNTGFVKKLKNFTSNQLESLLKDVSVLNLTKYLSEAATAIVQAKLKISDVTSAVELCNTIHHLYDEFSSLLYQSFQRHLSSKSEDPMLNCRKLNVDLKFYTELMNVGILNHEDSFPLIISVLTIAVSMDKEEYNNVNVILSFYRHCNEGYAVPRKMRNLAEKYKTKLPKCNLLSETEAQNVLDVLKDYYLSLVDKVTKVRREVKIYDYQNKKILQSRGELSGERKEKWDILNVLNERLLHGVKSLADDLGEEMPNFTDGKCENSDSQINDSADGEEDRSITALWEDEEEHHFYEILTNMKDFVPPPTPSKEQLAVAPPSVKEDTGTDDEDSDEEFTPEKQGDEKDAEADEIDEVVSVSNKKIMETFLGLLPQCMNCETVDKLSVEFVISLNNKCNRRKLIRALLGVNRTRSDLLPFYARLIATLNPVIPDISTEIAQRLKQEFKYHLRKKDQINIESKLKVVRFIGELVKFKLYSISEALYCIKLLLRDFSHHHIEMCCTFLEICGRFLFKNSDSHQRTKVYLEQMMRKKAVTALDSRYVTMIENAFYYVDPPDAIFIDKKEQPPMHEFIQRILYQDLSKSNIEHILDLMCKVDWENSEIAEFCIECLTLAYNVKYNNISCLASVVSGLACEEDEEFVGVLVVDGVMEDIRIGMELNSPKYNQRRIAMVKYMGELYKYRVAESSDIFKVLYSLISFGVTLKYSDSSFLDPPQHLLRIRLVCVLLETCGQYFNSGTSIKKLDYYLIYFQRYFLFKSEDKYWSVVGKRFPVGVRYLFQDTLFNLRPKITMYTSFQEADDAVHQLQISLATKHEDVSCLFNSSDEVLPGVSTDLGTITEESCETRSQVEDCKDDAEENNSGLDSDTYLSADGSVTENLNQQPENIKITKSSDDNGFLLAFDKMVSENIQNRKMEMVKPQHVDIPVPMNVKGNTKKSYEEIQHPVKEEKTSVNFVLLIKKGQKQHYKCLNVPADSELAIRLKTGEEAERAEKEHVKQLTLNMSQRIEEESYQEMLAQAQKAIQLSFNYDRKYKYHHPKGTPDPDLIFGSKKVR